MTYTAKELFQDWYSQGLKKDVTDSEINLRKKTIETIINDNEEDSNYWIDIIKIYNGSINNDSSTLLEFINAFKKDDENFPLKNNRNLIRTLAGCLIAQNIQHNANYNADMLALGLITSSFLSNESDNPIQEISQVAVDFWIKECERVRSLAPEIDISSKPIAFKTKKIENIIVTGANSSYGDFVTPPILNPQLAIITNQLNSTINDFSLINKSFEPITKLLENINQSVKTISEESNILWWLFGSYSKELSIPFKKLGFPLICIIAPKELSVLTMNLPGIGKVDNLLYKSFELTGVKIPEEIKFKDIINSIGSNTRLFKEVFNLMPKQLEEIVPCIFALHCFSEYEIDGWEAIFKKRTKSPTDLKVKPITFANQLYKELMLLRVFDIASK
jgi:thiol-disulfide isomerase/thioredoxin